YPIMDLSSVVWEFVKEKGRVSIKYLDKLHISKIMQIYVFYMPFLVLLCIIMMTLVRVLLFPGRGESIGLPLFLFNEVCPARKIPGQGRLR
ncbi:MAG: hypothetical protein MUO67_14510, partial [Anaerolineales bacterium]|nr:hypothetical protein [Anaerolineales bacterium]